MVVSKGPHALFIAIDAKERSKSGFLKPLVQSAGAAKETQQADPISKVAPVRAALTGLFSHSSQKRSPSPTSGLQALSSGGMVQSALLLAGKAHHELRRSHVGGKGYSIDTRSANTDLARVLRSGRTHPLAVVRVALSPGPGLRFPG